MSKIFLIIFLRTLLVHGIHWSQKADVIVNDVAFVRLGTYRGFTREGSEYQKTYFFARHSSGSFAEARSFCHSYGLEFLTMDTLEEARAVLTMADNNSILRQYTNVWIFIDGVTLTANSPTDWYWTNSGKKISYAIPWRSGAPNNYLNIEYCLSLGKEGINGKFGFDDINCNGKTLLSCHRIDFSIP